MAYERPRNKSRLLKNQKDDLLKQYFEDYRALYEKETSALNLKIPRGVFDDLLNELGEILLGESKRLANIEAKLSALTANCTIQFAMAVLQFH
jgi:hypothetical protein